MKRTPDQALFIVIDKPMPMPEQDVKRIKVLAKLVSKHILHISDLENEKVEYLNEIDAIKARQKARGKQ